MWRGWSNATIVCSVSLSCVFPSICILYGNNDYTNRWLSVACFQKDLLLLLVRPAQVPSLAVMYTTSYTFQNSSIGLFHDVKCATGWLPGWIFPTINLRQCLCLQSWQWRNGQLKFVHAVFYSFEVIGSAKMWLCLKFERHILLHRTVKQMFTSAK